MAAPPTSAPIALFSCAFTVLCPASTKTGLNRRLHSAAARRSENSLFGPKLPAEPAASGDSVISCSQGEAVGLFCQYPNPGRIAHKTGASLRVEG